MSDVQSNLQHDVVIITGGSGLIGAATVKRLTPTARVVGFDRHPGSPRVRPRRRLSGRRPSSLAALKNMSSLM